MSHETEIISAAGNRSSPHADPHPTVPELMEIRARGLEIRAATMGDLAFIDSLQKLHTRQVGWMPMKQLEGKIGRGHVLVAEERHEGTMAHRHEGTAHSVPP